MDKYEIQEIFIIVMPNTLSYPVIIKKNDYHIQWWSNLETHILHTLQCFDLAGF